MASLQRRSNGRWAVRWRDDQGRQLWRTFELRSEAIETLRLVELGIQPPPANAPEVEFTVAASPTFAAFAATWVQRQVWRPSTRRQVDCYLHGRLVPFFGDRLLTDITPADVQVFVRQLNDGLAAASVRVIIAHLRSIFNEALRDGLVQTSPVRHVRLPKHDRPPIVVPTPAQLQRLAAALPPHLANVVTFTASTGLRQGELFGLTLDRIDTEALTVRVDRQLTLDGVFGPPKTRASYRTIPISESLVGLIDRQITTFGLGTDGLVFTDRNGRSMVRRALSAQWQPAARHAGLPPRTGVHCLRHFYASLLIRSACSVKVVQARLGHATASETLDTYAHLWPDDDDRTRRAIEHAESLLVPTQPSTRGSAQ